MSLDLRRPALCTLAVADLDRAIAFWARLRVPLKLRSGRLAELQTDTILVQLVETSCAVQPDRGCVLAWEVADLDAARAALEERGIACADAPPPEGVEAAAFGRRLLFHDGDGHAFALVQP